MRGLVVSQPEKQLAVAAVLGFLVGFGGRAQVGVVLPTVALLALTCVFIFIIHFNSTRRYFLSAYLYIIKPTS